MWIVLFVTICKIVLPVSDWTAAFYFPPASGIFKFEINQKIALSKPCSQLYLYKKYMALMVSVVVFVTSPSYSTISTISKNDAPAAYAGSSLSAFVASPFLIYSRTSLVYSLITSTSS